MINIVFGLDDKFAAMCGACCASILANHKRKVKSELLKIVVDADDKIHFYFIGNLSKKNKKRLLDLKNIQDCECSFPDIDLSQFDAFPVNNFFKSRAAYYRLLAVDFVDGDRAVYLDCDMIVNCDIQLLWDMDLEDNFIAAVKDIGERIISPYFNSGLIVFDLKSLREWDFFNKVCNYVRDNKEQIENFIYPDQDLLNKIFNGNFKQLDERYNFMFAGHLENTSLKEDAIVHYAGIKPLSWQCPTLYRNLFFQYSQMTHWNLNMNKFYFELFKLSPLFFLKPKWIKRLKKMRAETKEYLKKQAQGNKNADL
ncbi:MAG: glycosyltransferase family 8 protein [Elusimicrobiota bacterium]|jgi:lipopolysaccharide biosynthesis glycosyltransferase|nr:glycosyltransferase family 8 protein [Elusimicrobiota bacterium]